jgi:hypothetical protein
MDSHPDFAEKFARGRKIMKKTWFALFAALTLTFCFSGINFGQDTTGSLTGTVKDANGAAVAGATVNVIDPKTNNSLVATATTTEDGVYSIPDLKPGTYTISVEAPSFKKSVTTGVTVDVGRRREQAVTVEAGRIDESVTVTADALAVELSAPTASTTINGDQIKELSLNNRNWVQLITLSPGVSANIQDQVYVGTTNPLGPSNQLNFSVNGVRQSSNTYTVDGADTTDRGANLTVQTYPSVDAIQQFTILRGLYPAETGRSSGGQINVITKSGGSHYHGDVYEFFRNNWLNANSFSGNATQPLGVDSNGKAKKSPFRYNDFGGTFGGPLPWPHFGEGGPAWEKGNTFFFFSEEVRRVIVYPTSSSQVPTADLRNGIFSQPVCVGAVANPCSVTANSIPQANWSPLAAAYVKDIYNKLPLPADAVGNLFFPTRGVFNFRQELIRLDHRFSNKLSAYYRFENDSIPTIEPFGLFGGSSLPFVATTKTNSPGRTHIGRATWSRSASSIFEFGASYSFGDVPSQIIGLVNYKNSPDVVAALPAFPFPVTRGKVPTISGNGFSSISSFGPYSDFSYNKSFFGTYTKIWGSHTMKFGGNFAWIRKHENSIQPPDANEGSYGAVSSSPTRPAGTTAQYQLWANFLLGNFQTFNQTQFDITADIRSRSIEAFGQDEWRFRSNITLYYGMRFSRYQSPWSGDGRLTNFDPFVFNPATAFQVFGNGNRVANSGDPFDGLVVNSQNPVPGMTVSPYGKSITRTPNNFAPRVGIAWDPFKKGTTSVRAGYGIYFDQVSFNPWETITSTNPPFQNKVSVTSATLDNPTGGSAVVSLAPQRVYGIDPNWKTPYVQHWSLDIQHQFGAKTLVTAGYYGSRGVHLTGLVDINLLPAGYALNLGATACAPTIGSTTAKSVPCQPQGYIFTASGAGSTTDPLKPGEGILNQIRPYRGYDDVRYLQTAFDSNYHSLQVTAQHRFTQSSQINMAYTWSKNMTDAQNEFSTAPQNTYDLRAEYARAIFDRRHIFNTNYVYEVPYYSDQKRFQGKLLGGWQLSGIFYFYTGLGFSPSTSSSDPAGLGLLGNSPSGARPNLVCDPNSIPHSLPPGLWFDKTCLVNPTTNAVGNAGRNTIQGPSTTRLDATLAKNIRFSESKSLQLRWEVFNVFNHTNFTTFLSTSAAASSAASVGKINIGAARDPRTMQLAAKFNF